MGYRRNRTVPLVFTGEMADFTAAVKVITLDEWLEVCDLTVSGLDFVPANRARLDELTERLIAGLAGWNLEDDNGAPVPVSVEAFKAQDKWFQATVINAWIDQMVQVTDPLDRPSSDGPAGELAEIPMAELDPASLAS